MAKRIIENVLQRLRDELGGDFVLYDANNGIDFGIYGENEDKAVGVAYSTFGNYIAIQNSTALESGLYVEFGIPIGEKYDKMIDRIESLSEKNNAQFKNITFNEYGAMTEIVKYVLVFDLQRPTSNITVAFDNSRQVVGLQIKVTASTNLAFGNDCFIEIKSGGKWQLLENVVSLDFSANDESLLRVDLNSYLSSYESQYAVQQVHAQYLFTSGSVLHTLLEGHKLSGVNSVYELRYTQNGVSANFKAKVLTYSHSSPIGGFQAVDIVFVRANSEDVQASYTLSFSPATNSIITVSRYGFNLSSGSTIYAGDELVISAVAGAGYTLTGIAVNGVSVPNGEKYTVQGDVNVVTSVQSGEVETFVLTIKEGAGTKVSVTSGGAPLKDGSIIQKGETLTFRANGETGYELTSLTVDGQSITSGAQVIVADNVLVVSVGASKTLKLTLNLVVPSNIPQTQAKIKIYRVKDFQGSVMNELILDSDEKVEATIKYGDILKYIYQIVETKQLMFNYMHVNGESILPNSERAATTDVSVIAVFTAIAYRFTYDAPGAFVEARKGDGTKLTNGSTVFWNEMIEYEVAVYSDYWARTVTMNGRVKGNNFEGAESYYDYVDGNMSLAATIFSQITYIGQSGSTMGTVDVDYGKTTTILSSGSSGYRLDYWSTTADGSGVRYSGGQPYSGRNITLHAIGKQYAYFHVYFFASNGNKANVTVNSNKNTDYTATNIKVSSSVQASIRAFTSTSNVNFTARILSGDYQSGAVDVNISGVIESGGYNGSTPTEDSKYIYGIGRFYYYP